MTEPASESGATEEAAPQPKKIGGTALRFASAIPVIAVVLYVMFWAPKWGFSVFGLIWLAIVSWELMGMSAPSTLITRGWGVLATLGVASVLLFVSGTPQFPLALLTALFGLVVGALVVGLVAPDPVEEAKTRIGWLLGGPIYVAGTLSTARPVSTVAPGCCSACSTRS